MLRPWARTSKPLIHATLPPRPPFEVEVSAVIVSNFAKRHDQAPRRTYLEYHYHILLAFHHNIQIESDLKSLERLVNEDVLNTARRDESRRARPQVTRAGSARLHAQTTNHEQRLRRVAPPEDQPRDATADQEAPQSCAVIGEQGCDLPEWRAQKSLLQLRSSRGYLLGGSRVVFV
nr:hypothetical protein CFP56_04015 [Quercus suber]